MTKDESQQSGDLRRLLNTAYEELSAWVHHECDLYLSCPVSRVPDVSKVRTLFQRIVARNHENSGLDSIGINDHLQWLSSAERLLEGEDSRQEIDAILSIAMKYDNVVLISRTADILYHIGQKKLVAQLISEWLWRSPEDPAHFFLDVKAFAAVLSPEVIGELDRGLLPRIQEGFTIPLASKMLVLPEWSRLRSMIDATLDQDE